MYTYIYIRYIIYTVYKRIYVYRMYVTSTYVHYTYIYIGLGTPGGFSKKGGGTVPVPGGLVCRLRFRRADL